MEINEQNQMWQGSAHFYNAFADFYLNQDTYSITSVLHPLVSSIYGEDAKKIISLIHSDEQRLSTEGEIKIMKDELSLLERDYANVDPHQISMYYKSKGYEIEGFEPDHLGVELKFLAILSLETAESENKQEAIPNELRYLNNRFVWLERLEDALEKDSRNPELYKSCVRITNKYINNHIDFLTDYIKLPQ